MANGEVLAQRIKSPAKRGTPMEFWTWGGLRLLITDDEPGLRMLPAGATPETPKNSVVFFARESGAGTGKFQLCGLGPSGLVQILFTEP